MYRITKKFSLFIFISILTLLGFNSREYTLESPDENIQLIFSLDQGAAQYEINYKGKTFLLPSVLGFEFENQSALDSDFAIVGTHLNNTDKTWESSFGTTKRVRNYYNELTIELKEEKKPERKMNLIFRAYNDGIALRYEIPEQKNVNTFSVMNELTSFNFASNYEGFGMKRTGFDGNYEGFYIKRKLSDITQDTLIAMPLLLQLENGWTAITEAALTDYAGMSLAGVPDKPNELISTLAPLVDEETAKAKIKTPFRTPWRTIMINKQAGDLITSNLILNLNNPNKIDDTSYIKPGQVLFPWWNGRIADNLEYSGEPSTSVMKYYIDFAAEYNIPNLMVDAGWYSLEGEAWDTPKQQNLLTMEETRRDYYNIREVIDYGNKMGVKIHLWVHLTSLKDEVEKVLSAYADWGAAGIKVDSYGGDNQQHIADVQHVTKIAAQHNLIVNFHGAYKPTGWERTYPNLMTREAVLANEQAVSKQKPIPTAKHNVTIPYTRMLAGPMDYTPGAFDLDGTEEYPKYVKTTRAQQIAMYVVYYSPLQMLIDYPGAYKKHLEQFKFVLDIPTVWDESRFIAGQPAEYIIMARRNNNQWYVGVMTNEEAREASIPLNFLKKGQQYNAKVLADAADADVTPEHVNLSTQKVMASDTLKIKLAESGGAAIVLSPKE